MLKGRLLLPESAHKDVRFQLRTLLLAEKWPYLQREAFKKRILEEKPPDTVSKEMNLPRITVDILLLYGKIDIGIEAIRYRIENGIPLSFLEEEPFYKALIRERVSLCERLAEKRKDRIFEAVKAKIGLQTSADKITGG